MRVAALPLSPFREAEAARRRWASGISALDAALGGGFLYEGIHEVYASTSHEAAATAGFAAVLATAMAPEGKSLLWLRACRGDAQAGRVQGAGLAELGSNPGRWLFVQAPDACGLLRATADALRCATLGAVLLELWGKNRELDLTASRRLALAAEKSGVPLLLLRIDATPIPSAAQTRWEIAAAPSQALPANAPGLPTFDIELLRQRGGPSGLRWRLEWDREQGQFREAAPSGAVVSVPVGGSLADRTAQPEARSERHAA